MDVSAELLTLPVGAAVPMRETDCEPIASVVWARVDGIPHLIDARLLWSLVPRGWRERRFPTTAPGRLGKFWPSPAL